MSDLTLRSLYPEDINRVSEIESSLTGSPRKAFLEKRLAVATAMPDSFITSAVLDDKKLAGYGFARILEGEFGARSAIAVLDDFGVDIGYRGRGIGKMLMSGIERRMKNRNISTLQSQIVWSNHSMIRFFAAAGFTLASGQIIERNTSPLDEEVAEIAPVKMDGKWRVHSGAGGNHYDKLARDRVLVRSLKGEDIASIDRIDTKLTGLDRSAYYASKFREMLDESGIRVSMVSEEDGIVTGFIMARVDYGEFGKVDKTAAIDTIGVHPAYSGSGVGHALLSQLLLNLSSLQVESVRTKLEHENYALRNFLTRRGFKPSQRLLLTREIM
ncbi:MAG: GNAT family N-acetyltransferase [Desulfuromonadaceae bacterium]|nr:GNAT family N-acetyltransferase [Desulfuromonadaceae bacterium]